MGRKKNIKVPKHPLCFLLQLSRPWLDDDSDCCKLCWGHFQVWTIYNSWPLLTSWYIDAILFNCDPLQLFFANFKSWSLDDTTHCYHLKCHFLLKPFLADIFILNKVESACASFLTLPSGFRPSILSNLFLSTSRWGNVSVRWYYSGDEFNKLAHFAQGIFIGPPSNQHFQTGHVEKY